MAQALGKRGAGREGLSVLAERVAMADQNEERHYEAGLYRLKASLTLQQFQVQVPSFSC